MLSAENEKLNDYTKPKSFGIHFKEWFIKYFQAILLFVFIFFIIVAGWLYLAWWQERIVNLRADLDKQQRVMEEQMKKFSQLSYPASAQEIKEQLQVVDLALPETTRLPEIFTQLEQLAQKNSLALSAVAVLENITPSPQGEVDHQDLQLEIRGGDYFSIKKFISDIEDNARIIDVLSMKYSPSAGNFNLVARCYFLPYEE